MLVKYGGSDDCRRRLDINYFKANIRRVARTLALQDVQ